MGEQSMQSRLLSSLRSHARTLREFHASSARRASEEPLKKTLLNAYHAEQLQGKMVEFGGWDMPVQYKWGGVLKETLHTRAGAGLFDVSHMCSTRFYGKDVAAFMESITPCDYTALLNNTGKLTCLTNDSGGMIDDCIVTKTTATDETAEGAEHAYVVLNAGCADKDLAHIETHLASFTRTGGDCSMEVLQDRGLLALQGPKAASVLQEMTDSDLSKMSFGDSARVVFNGIPCFATRSGYTGEDGFEIFVPGSETQSFVEAVLSHEDAQPIGLGARDSLRLEAGLCLYGHDIDETTSPIEAGLAWSISKRRRAEGGFPGATTIQAHLQKGGCQRKRVGLVYPKGAPAREGSEITLPDGTQIGQVTSGGPSPTLKKEGLPANIAMGYVSKGNTKAGTAVNVVVRGKVYEATITKMPFVPTKYFKA